MAHNLFIGIDGGASFCRTLIRDMQAKFVLADGFVATIACGNSHRWPDMHEFVTAREALKLDHKLDWAPSDGRWRRQSFAFGR